MGPPLVDATPIAWPSLSDLAHLLGISLSTLSRFPSVRRRPTRRVGREVKVRPSDAVAILVERGLSPDRAEASVRTVVDQRRDHIPALRDAEQAPPVVATDIRLERSDFDTTQAIPLERSDLYRASGVAYGPEVPEAARYADLDRRFAGRSIPLEPYIYDTNR
jgi:hypothetical protein